MPERGFFTTPDRFGMHYDDVVFQSADGTGLHGWFLDRHEEDGVGPLTILFMHGIAGNVSHRIENVAALCRELDARALLFDYRGYGRSSGEPSVEGVVQDAEAALQLLIRRPEVDPSRILLFGHSMGGAIAIELAARQGRQVCGLVVESSFTTGREIAKLFFPLVPANAVPVFFDSETRIKQIEVPVMITHGECDSLLPPSMGRALCRAAPEPRSFFLVPGADHHDVFKKGGVSYFQALSEFIQKCTDQSRNES